MSLEGTLLLGELEIPVSIKISIMPPESSEQLIVSCTDLTAIKENEKESLKNKVKGRRRLKGRKGRKGLEGSKGSKGMEGMEGWKGLCEFLFFKPNS